MPPSANLPSARFHHGARRWALIALAIILALLLLVALVVWQWDWNRARPWVNDKVSETTGRHFAIEGDLTADWQWPQPLEVGWQRWIPGVTLHAQQLVLGNRADFGAQGALDPTDARGAPPALDEDALPPSDHTTDNAPPMAKAAEVSASLRLLPLLKRTLSLGTVVLDTPDVALARLADGRNNWTFTPRHAPAQTENPWNVAVDQVQVTQGQIAYADGIKDLALRAHIDTLDSAASQSTPDAPVQAERNSAAEAQDAARYGVQFKVSGRFANASVEGEGKAGDLLTLRQKKLNYPLQFSAHAGDTRAQVQGTLSNPTALAGMDLQVMLSGATMADLYKLTGLVLPNTPPYKTTGRLVGDLMPERATWDYQDFQGTVGQSDVHGHLTYTSGKPRPKLTGQVQSKTLRLADIGPVLGTPAGASAKDKQLEPAGKVLPHQKFAAERWNAMDMDVVFKGQKIVDTHNLPLENVSVHVVLDNATLKLDPLRFGVAQGAIDAQIVLNSRADPLQAQVRATVEGLKLSALFPKVELMDKSFGRMDGALALSGQGDSVAAMLGTATGEARLYVRDGTLSKQMLDLAALNLGSVVVAKLFGETSEVNLRCAVADLSVKNGIAQTRSAKLNTNEAIVEAVGTIDMAHEHVDLRIKPESLEWKFLSLRTPLYVRGAFAAPKVGIEPGPLLLRAGAALVAAAVAPAALALVPITVPAADDDAHCARLMARATAAVKAGPAGAATRPPPEDTRAASPKERKASQSPAPAKLGDQTVPNLYNPQ